RRSRRRACWSMLRRSLWCGLCSLLPEEPLLALLNLRHERNPMEPRARQPTHDPHDRTIIDLAVTAHKDALLHTAASRRNRLELGQDVIHCDLGVLQIPLSLAVNRNGERLLVLVKTLGLRLRQVERHANR